MQLINNADVAVIAVESFIGERHNVTLLNLAKPQEDGNNGGLTQEESEHLLIENAVMSNRDQLSKVTQNLPIEIIITPTSICIQNYPRRYNKMEFIELPVSDRDAFLSAAVATLKGIFGGKVAQTIEEQVKFVFDVEELRPGLTSES